MSTVMDAFLELEKMIKQSLADQGERDDHMAAATARALEEC